MAELDSGRPRNPRASGWVDGRIPEAGAGAAVRVEAAKL